MPLTFETLRIILPYAVILAAIDLIESLLTLLYLGFANLPPSPPLAEGDDGAVYGV